ncbi:globin [Evansella sp. AB-rgal1]|uniref:globin domain-containing protein n=1 Tax=Evansella sp. AB-rgal1 TaxID=3242696 RepID=UPI00359EAA78
MDLQDEKTPYEILGKEKLSSLVDTFYELVAKDPELSLIFPDDLHETARKQKQFLTQFLGGPPLYTTEHGHPMLRARHMPFTITPSRANAWMLCMNEAMEHTNIKEPLRSQILSRLSYTAKHMINSQEI